MWIDLLECLRNVDDVGLTVTVVEDTVLILGGHLLLPTVSLLNGEYVLCTSSGTLKTTCLMLSGLHCGNRPREGEPGSAAVSGQGG